VTARRSARHLAGVPRPPLVALVALVSLLVSGCDASHRRPAPAARTLVVYNAGSLARPLRAALDTFAMREGVDVQQESAGSLETARKLTELGKVPDLIALADHELFPRVLMPEHVAWYARFARNRMVLAYTPRSRFADEIATENWSRLLLRPGVEVGRADPDLDPNGYRTLLAMQLAERHYREPGLAARLLAAAPARNVRPKEADLVALLQAGELDYAWSYESIARGAGLRFVELPSAVDLGDPEREAEYAAATIAVRGRSIADTVVMRGTPIVYGFSVPRGAPHAALAERLAAFLLSPEGRRVMTAAQLDVLERPQLVGGAVPAAIREAAALGDSPRLEPVR
jgi:molybdate/tungstate transport system substrate-binding protein